MWTGSPLRCQTGYDTSSKMDPPTLGELSYQTPVASGLDGPGLDKVADQTPEKQTGLMNVLRGHYSKQRWL